MSRASRPIYRYILMRSLTAIASLCIDCFVENKIADGVRLALGVSFARLQTDYRQRLNPLSDSDLALSFSLIAAVAYFFAGLLK